jgi:hypothetical protein
MKTIEDIRKRVKLEITHYYKRYPGVLSGKLWYHPTTAERDGGILAAATRPAPGYKLVTSQRLVMPADDVVQRLTILGILDRLPVLEKRNH